jgi:ADP-ribosyltransferase exoenzyme
VISYVDADGRELTHGRAVEYAEARLGRPLTDGEQHLDLVGLDLDLEDGKQRLIEAIEEEKRRAIRRYAQFGIADMAVTQEMLAVMEELVEAGRRHAEAEIRSMGVEPRDRFRAFAEGDDRVAEFLRQLLAALTGIRVRIGREAAEFRNQGSITEDLIDRLDERIPGARSAAADIVSGLLIGGLGEVYEHNADLFPCWVYSAVMDAATCEVCRTFDGREYPTWEAGMLDLPGGGPNPLCLGNGRCRCRLVACPPGLVERPAPPAPEPQDDETAVVVRDYQNRLAFSLNEKLRRGEDLLPDEERAVEILDRFTTEETLAEPLRVWRGVDDMTRVFGVETIAEFKSRLTGTIFEERGYMSSTTGRETADVFASGVGRGREIMLRIDLPAGARIGRPRFDVQMIQDEVLLPRGSRLKIEGVLRTREGTPVVVARLLID